MLFTLITAAFAASTSELTWDLTFNGTPVGKRSVKVKIVPSNDGPRRIMEAWTEIDGNLGPIPVQFRQRLTAHAQGSQPASFHSVIDQSGEAIEVQGRWTPGGWTVTTNVDGRVRTAGHGATAIDLSTPDLLDPLSSVGFGGRSEASVLSAITGDVLTGSVTSLGPVELKIDGKPVPVDGFTWSSPEGKSDFFFSSEGYLVKFRIVILGAQIEGLLTDPPPGGVDDFPVAAGRPSVEVLPL